MNLPIFPRQSYLYSVLHISNINHDEPLGGEKQPPPLSQDYSVSSGLDFTCEKN